MLVERFWKGSTTEGDSPVDENIKSVIQVPKYRGTREILWESGRTTFQG